MRYFSDNIHSLSDILPPFTDKCINKIENEKYCENEIPGIRSIPDAALLFRPLLPYGKVVPGPAGLSGKKNPSGITPEGTACQPIIGLEPMTYALRMRCSTY